MMTMVLAGCDGQTMSNQVVAQNDEFSVTGDSVTQGNIIVCAVSPQHLESNLNLNTAEQMLQHSAGTDTVPYCMTTGAETRPAASSTYPTYQSQQMLIDALYNLSVADINANHSQNGGFNSHQDHNNLYGTIYLALALIDPQRAKTSLKNQVEDQLVMQQEGTWPVCDDRMAWPIAAWEVYCATGDRQWLNEAYDITLNTIDEELEVQLDHKLGLMHGGQLARFRSGIFYPDWANAITMTEVETTICNILAIRAMEVANLMAEELGEPIPYEQEAQHLRETVNQLLWDENRGGYCAYLQGRVTPMQSPMTDNMAQALAVLWDLADDDRSSKLVENTPIGHRGILPTYPAASIEPYLEHPAWSLTQAYWNVAAATVGNEHALRRGLAALYRAQAFYQPHHMAIDGKPINTLANATANIAMVLRLFAGMRLTPDGLEFRPFVPECLPGNKTLLNVAYRNATLDITIVGCGNDIDKMTLDGQPVEGDFVPGDIEGHHNLLIKLRKGKTHSNHVTLATHALLPSTPMVSWDSDSARITSWQPALAHKLVINGARSYSLSDSTFALPPLPPLAELCVVTANRYGYSMPSPLLVTTTSLPYTLTLNDSTLQADTLSLKLRVDHAGDYLVRADYTIDNGCDIMLIEANGHQMGCLYLPSTGTAATQRTGYTTLQLLRGNNVITLRRYRIGFRATVPRLIFIR